MLSLGIDEAGRGCVIGPLVVAIVAATEQDKCWFYKHRVRDSKIVPANERTRLAEAIMARCWFRVKVATAPEVDRAVFDRSRTLNGLELEHMSECLRDACEHFPDHELRAVVDAPSINAQKFREDLYTRSGWGEMERLEAKHYADERDRTVAAASIIAKYERERLIVLLKQEIGYDFGCGYPHDSRTIEYLSRAIPGATHIRWSWKTAQSLCHTFPTPHAPS